MKIVFSELADNYIDKFTLRKSIDNTYAKTEIQAEVIYSGADFQTLLTKAATAQGEDTGTITDYCEIEEIEKDILIKHNEGIYDMKRCEAKKKIVFANPLDCIAQSEVNIFDYPSGMTTTFQGELQRFTEVKTAVYNFGDETNVYTLDQVLGIVGDIVNYSAAGYVPEFIQITVIPAFENIQGSPDGENYIGHDITLTVNYIRIFSNTQINSDWFLQPVFGGYFYNPDLIPSYRWNAPSYNSISITGSVGLETYTQTEWTAGKYQLYKDASISNTVLLNDVLTGIFSCTGLELVSNFFGINEDGTNPRNKYYDYATKYCHDIKIVQSFDIIRESAIQDSFGVSGKIKGKDLLADISQLYNLVVIPDLENNLIRWEHVSYFQTKGFDFSERDEIDIEPLELSREPLDREVFTMGVQTPTPGFYSITIEYQTTDIYREPAEKPYQVKNIITDIFGTLNNEDYNKPEYEKLFYLLSTDGDNIIGLNNQFSMNTIFRELHDVNRPYKRGTSGEETFEFTGFSIGFETEIKTKTGVKNFDTLWPTMAIKTKYGSFLINEIEYNEKQILTLKVRK